MSIQEQIINVLQDNPMKASGIVTATAQQADSVHRILRQMTTDKYLNITGNKFYSINYENPYAEKVKKKPPGRKKNAEPMMEWSTPSVERPEHLKAQFDKNEGLREMVDALPMRDKAMELVDNIKPTEETAMEPRSLSSDEILAEVEAMVQKMSMPTVHFEELSDAELKIDILKLMLPLLDGPAHLQMDDLINWVVNTSDIIRES